MKPWLKWTLISLPILVGGFIVYQKLRNKNKKEVVAPPPPPPPPPPRDTTSTGGTTSPVKSDFPLALGSRGENVKSLQNAIIATGNSEVIAMLGKSGADGHFGPGTEKAVVKLLGKNTVNLSDIAAITATAAAGKLAETLKKSRIDTGWKIAKISMAQKKVPSTIQPNVPVVYGKITTDGRFVFQKRLTLPNNISIGDATSVFHGGVVIDTKSPDFKVYPNVQGELIIRDNKAYYTVFPEFVQG